MRFMIAVTGLLVLAACSPGDTRKIAPPAAVAPIPGEMMTQTFANCTWGEVKSSVLSIWAFSCGPDYGGAHVVPSGSGFDIETTSAEGLERRSIVKVFTKAPDAPLDSVLPAVRAASPGPATETCAFAPSTSYDNAGKPRFVLEPTGPAKVAWDASVQGDAPGDAPCGDLGVSIVDDRYFEVAHDSPVTVVFVDLGSEIQIFDAQTLKAASAH